MPTVTSTSYINNMTIVQSIRRKDQLIFNDFYYRQDRLVRRCITRNCRERVRFDWVCYTMYEDRICQVSNLNETEKSLHTHEIRQKAKETNDPLRLIMRNERGALPSDATAVIPQYRASQPASERIRQGKDIRLERKSYTNIIIP
jgi:hypothetical protein